MPLMVFLSSALSRNSAAVHCLSNAISASSAVDLRFDLLSAFLCAFICPKAKDAAAIVSTAIKKRRISCFIVCSLSLEFVWKARQTSSASDSAGKLWARRNITASIYYYLWSVQADDMLNVLECQ